MRKQKHEVHICSCKKNFMCGRYDGVLKMDLFKPIDVECIENFRHFLRVSITQFYMALHNVTQQKFQKELVQLFCSVYP